MYKNSILINRKIKISNSFTKEDFKKTDLYRNQDLSMFFWVRYDCEIYNHKFFIGLLFNERYIKQLQLYCTDVEISNEKQRKIFNDKFALLLSEFIDFKFCDISSVFDERGNMSIIVLDFKRS